MGNQAVVIILFIKRVVYIVCINRIVPIDIGVFIIGSIIDKIIISFRVKNLISVNSLFKNIGFGNLWSVYHFTDVQKNTSNFNLQN